MQAILPSGQARQKDNTDLTDMADNVNASRVFFVAFTRSSRYSLLNVRARSPKPARSAERHARTFSVAEKYMRPACIATTTCTTLTL